MADEDTKLTQEEAGYMIYPFEGLGPMRRTARSVYPCYRCKHWQGAKGKDAKNTVATCDLIEGEVGWHSNCLYWTLYGVRRNLKAVGKLGKALHLGCGRR